MRTLFFWLFFLMIVLAILIAGTVVGVLSGEFDFIDSTTSANVETELWSRLLSMGFALVLWIGVFLLIWAIIRGFGKLLASSHNLFGSNLANRVLSLAAVAYFLPNPIVQLVWAMLNVLVTFYRSLVYGYEQIQIVVGNLEVFAEGQPASRDVYASRVVVQPFEVLQDFVGRIDILGWIYVLGLWVILGKVFDMVLTVERDEVGSRGIAGWLRLRGKSIKSETQHRLALTVTFLVGVYLSVASLAAIPWLQETETPTGVNKEELALRLDEVSSQSDKNSADLPEDLPLPAHFEGLEGLLNDLSKKNDRVRESLVTQNQTTGVVYPIDLGTLIFLKGELTKVKDTQNTLRDQWKTVRGRLIDGMDDLRQSGLVAFERHELATKGSREKIDYFHTIIEWNREGISRLRSALADVRSNLLSQDKSLKNWADEIEGSLRSLNLAQGQPSDPWNPDLGRLFFFNAPVFQPYEIEAITQSSWISLEVPTPPQPGSKWGPFRFVASWLLQTQSLSLALITGMLGAGVLGSSASTYVRSEIAERTGDKTALDALAVIIRGFSAAVVVFLAVEGGLAIFGTTSVEPNAYILLLTCLLGAVFSDQVWEWGRNRLATSLSSGGQRSELSAGQLDGEEAKPPEEAKPQTDTESEPMHSEPADNSKTRNVSGSGEKPKADEEEKKNKETMEKHQSKDD